MEENNYTGISFISFYVNDTCRQDFKCKHVYPVDRLGGVVVIEPARRAGDPGLNPGPGENFSLKFLISTCHGYSESQNYI